jgi:hypothetical protein
MMKTEMEPVVCHIYTYILYYRQTRNIKFIVHLLFNFVVICPLVY